MSRIIHVLLIMSVVFSSGYAFAQSPDTPKESVEVVAGGKIYPSVHAYKLQKLKDDLRGVLSPGQLREFSEEELSSVIREIQFQPPAMAQLPSPEVTAPAADEQIGQMEEMLTDYNTRHGDAPPLTVDPAKVKTIILKPPLQEQE
ncbi:MAG: hypothetical protein HZC18_04810 [Candidatus Omnitrophica bacterium]|nr:hypothetical protein [Candidatus Omnitrophota bacterium]